ncbi:MULTISPECIES: peptidylprolyl isomerase [unclassified Rhizobium]|uniref:peptidylprolyl isomerase n=1 Tax=unclassified Rhizobium TaxID=2613769 RepID=UPI000CDF33C5|nr:MULTISPECIES: peptidylprolyl isomerase [Rhizobium]AVA26340.1 peptidylprolyl isomerase PpiC-type domain-containing protein [Rhizobium sp. NXC24]UWU24000.1 peptidylprolyl isomerase [Rhizobium tropici]
MVSIVIDRTAARAHEGHNHRHEHVSASARNGSSEPLTMPPVSVNGVSISRKDIAAETQNFPAVNPGAAWYAATRALVIRQLLMQEASRLGLTAEPQRDADGRVETEEDALLRALVEREVETPKADDEMLVRFYENNRKRFVTPPLYEADHILIAARREDGAAFGEARERVASLAAVLAEQPERFAALARDCSDCSSREVGGSLGQISPGETTPEFEAALAGLTPGEISAPVETRYGVHLIRLVRRIEGRRLPFEAVRDRIARYLEEHVLRQATAQYISLLIGRADIRGIALEGATTPLVQ